MIKAEFVILVDAADKSIGKMEKYLAHRLNKKHRAFSIMLVDDQGRCILQRRAAGKYHSPNLWTNVCCGHPRPGEDTQSAASRRLQEEMGIQPPLHYLFSTSYAQQVELDMWENEYDHIFIGQYSSDVFHPNSSEISEIRKLSLSELEKEITDHPEHYTFWFRLIFPKLKSYLT